MLKDWIARNFKFAAGENLRIDLVRDPGGNDAVAITGTTLQSVEEQAALKSARFYWNGRVWMRQLRALQNDLAAQQALRDLGLPIDDFLTPSAIPKPRPTTQPQKSQNWVLGEGLGDRQGTLLALQPGEPGTWNYLDENGVMGTLKTDEARSMVKSVRRPDGSVVQGPDPAKLIQEYKDHKPETEEKPKIPGRIPDAIIGPYQKEIRDTFTETDENIVMNALAGTGKTTMLRDLASHKDPNEKWLYLVFNKKNQIEASTGKGKFPEGTEVLTSHSFLGKVLSNSSEKGGIKHTELWHEKGERLPRILDEIMEHDDSFPRQIQFSAKKAIKQVTGLAKAYAVDPKDPGAKARIQEIIQKYQIDTDLSTERYRSDRNWAPQIIEKTLEALHFSLPENAKGEFAGLRDHDDTLWYAAINENVYWPHYDVVLADEVQDFNKCQSIMLQKLSEAGARIVAVGDPHQCHPAGTMIYVTGGKTKPIEEINLGEEVVTYNSKKSYFPGINTQGRKVLNKVSRSYSGKMITITTKNGLSYQCTPNHRCFVRFNPNSNENYVLYLMIRKNNARIGIAKIKYFETFGPTNRARQEGADKLWALETFESEYEARIAEAYVSAKFGLPQTLFKYSGQGTEFNQNFLDAIYSKIGNNIRKAKKCIESFGRSFEFPLWTKENQERFGRLRQNYIGSKKSFVTQACNLMSGIMQVRTFDGTPKGGQWERIQISYNNANCTVYSLEVEHTEDGKKLYVANGIVTHNSIYMFRGADADAFENVTSITTGAPNGGVSRPLPVNYRCGKKIIEYVNQNTHVKDLQAGKEHEGEVTEGMGYDESMYNLAKEWSTTGKLSTQTAFISRTNRPLVDAALELLTNNMDFQIIGRDFSKELIEVLERVTGKGRFAKHFPVHEFPNRMGSYLDDLEQKWRGKLSKVDELAELRNVSDSLANIVNHLASTNFKDDKLRMTVKDTEDFIDYIRKKFSGVNIDTVKGATEYARKDPKSFVTLTTAHRSKGLEFSRVYILGTELFPHPKAKTPDELKQENNAWYVALTRAMNALHVLAPLERRASVWVRRNCRFGKI